jgi:predicted adenine nucleotide alpha hydrolase (AANH) superfamily ATPase
MKKRLLLHVCCAPDATVPYQRLKDEYEVIAFFYNPNIHGEEEYQKRLHEVERLAKLWDFPLIVGEYNVEQWFSAVRGLEDEPEGGKRCEVCYSLRLEETAKLAKELGCEAFATVLTISPHKKAEKINAIGKEAGERHGIAYLESDFKKKDGFKESVRISRELNLYRQNYCGCRFSMR